MTSRYRWLVSPLQAMTAIGTRFIVERSSLIVHEQSSAHIILFANSLAADDTLDVKPKPPDAQVVLADTVFLQGVELLPPSQSTQTKNKQQQVSHRVEMYHWRRRVSCRFTVLPSYSIIAQQDNARYCDVPWLQL